MVARQCPGGVGAAPTMLKLQEVQVWVLFSGVPWLRGRQWRALHRPRQSARYLGMANATIRNRGEKLCGS